MASIKIWTADGWKYVTSKGDKGDKGEGIPIGGTLGQVLAKKSTTNYDTEWINPPSGGGATVDDASETVKGIVELATQAEVDTGTDAIRVVTPATLQAKIDTITYVHPTGDGNLHIPAAAVENLVTWSPDDKFASISLDATNKIATMPNTGGSHVVRATKGYTVGKRYFEAVLSLQEGYSVVVGIVTGDYDVTIDTNGMGASPDAWTYSVSNAVAYLRHNYEPYGVSSTAATGDTVGVAVDLDAHTARWYLNGELVSANYWNDSDIGAKEIFPAVGGYYWAGAGKFAAADFTYAPPAGYEAWDSSSNNNNKVLTAVDGVPVWQTLEVYTDEKVDTHLSGVAAKTDPVDNDALSIIDSETSSALKKVTWANVKAKLKAYFDTQYNNYVHPVGDGNLHIPATAIEVPIAGTTWNPSDKQADVVLSNGNLTATGNNAGYYAGVRSTESKSTGKWYFEVVAVQINTYLMVGAEHGTYDISKAPGNAGVGGFGYKYTGSLYLGGSYVTVSEYVAGDVIGVALDCDNKTADFYKNNVHQGTQITNAVFTTTPIFAAVGVGLNDIATSKFAAADLTYSPPSGYSAWDSGGTALVPVGAGKVLTAGDTAGEFTWADLPEVRAKKTATFVLHRGENATVGTNKTNPYIVAESGAPDKCFIACGIVPTGNRILCDIKKNGTSIWSTVLTSRPAIADSSSSGNTVTFDTGIQFAEGDILTADIVEIGSTIAGGDVTMILRWS